MGWDGVVRAASGLAFVRATQQLALITKGPAACPAFVLDVTHIISLNHILPVGVGCSYALSSWGN